LSAAAAGEGPLVSVLMPVYETDRRLLDEAIESVRAQLYPHWELCIVNDGSPTPAVRRAIEHAAGRDDRIRAAFLPQNRGIAAATNEALGMAGGELVAFLDHDDLLAPEALQRVAEELAAHPEADLLYTDEDKIGPDGRGADPFLKPDWSPVYALGAMYVGHLLAVRRERLLEVGGADSAYDSIQDFELMLRLTEQTGAVRHIPEVLYHWRAIPGSIAAGTSEKEGIEELQARAVNAHLERRGLPLRAAPHPRIPHRARLDGAPRRRVSAVVAAPGPSPRLQSCLESLRRHPEDEPDEVIVVSRGAAPADAGARWIDTGGPWHRSRALNLGARAARGERLLFLAPTVEARAEGWLAHLCLVLEIPGVAAAGPVLERPGGEVSQAGQAIGLHDPLSPAHRGARAGGDGYYGSLACAREVAALDSECMLVARDAFDAAGGFREEYRTQFEGADLCMRLRREGLTAVCTPESRMVSHATAAERRAAFDVVDRALFVDSWWDELSAGDPYYNPGLSRERADFTPESALPPKMRMR
jgi:GT2 family glycosyltransferase